MLTVYCTWDIKALTSKIMITCRLWLASDKHQNHKTKHHKVWHAIIITNNRLAATLQTAVIVWSCFGVLSQSHYTFRASTLPALGCQCNIFSPDLRIDDKYC